MPICSQRPPWLVLWCKPTVAVSVNYWLLVFSDCWAHPPSCHLPPHPLLLTHPLIRSTRDIPSKASQKSTISSSCKLCAYNATYVRNYIRIRLIYFWYKSSMATSYQASVNYSVLIISNWYIFLEMQNVLLWTVFVNPVTNMYFCYIRIQKYENMYASNLPDISLCNFFMYLMTHYRYILLLAFRASKSHA